MTEQKSINMNNNNSKEIYPPSVQEFSTMMSHAQRQTSPEYEYLEIQKAHTCGSLFANCKCSNSSDNITRSFYSYSKTSVEQNKIFLKRGSIPSSSSTLRHFYPNVDKKRLSNPEVQVRPLTINFLTKRCNSVSNGAKSPTKNVVRANVYLEHPEVNFPIPVEFSEDSSSSSTIVESELPKSILKTSSTKTTTSSKPPDLGAESCRTEFENAEKFLRDFGILDPMGNGVATTLRSTSKNSLDESAIKQIRKTSKCLVEVKKRIQVHDDYEEMRNLVEELKNELGALEKKYDAMRYEFCEKQKLVDMKNKHIAKLQREVDKLKSVLQQTTLTENGDILASLQDKHAMANRLPLSQQTYNTGNYTKKQGVSAEANSSLDQASDINIAKYDKDFRSKQLIKDAIMDNDFLKHLDTSQVREIVDSMFSKEYGAGSFVIKEGEAGAHLFVGAEGNFEVIKEGNKLGQMSAGKAFGELAILYNCTRTASIRALTDSKVWVLDRKVFQQIMVRTGLQRLQDNINFLRSVPLLQTLSNDILAKIADSLEVEFYPAGVYIIRQGTRGDTFFIISSGSVKVTQKTADQADEKEIRILHRGEYFGEQALLNEDCRTASILTIHPGVECLTLDRDSFNQLIGDLSEIKEKSYDDEERGYSVELQEYGHIQLNDLEVIATLGIGGFGRVELVQYLKDPSLTFALKCLKKQHIVDTQQQGHVFSERNIMMACKSPFITRMYRTYRDSKYVYMLLEACLGGEVWTILRDRGSFDDTTTRFIVACVIQAFEYLHSRGIIYRDLKPENLLLDSTGYIKLVDFGFSKKMGYSNKTWTFCGTPEYVAPETILNKGHDRAVDYWALGILMHELLTGNPPFTATDPMKTYNLILRGIDMIDFAKHNVTRSAQSLIKKLCRDLPSERLGYQRSGIQDIKKHRWFQSFDWDGLQARTLQAPIVHPIRSPCDTTNFDCYGKEVDNPPDETSDWDLDF